MNPTLSLLRAVDLELACVFAACLIARPGEVPRGTPPDADLRDHLEAELPVHFEVVQVSFKCLGRPVREVHARLTIEATEPLYRPATPAEMVAAGADLGPFLKRVTRAREAIRDLKLEFTAAPGPDGWTFGTLATSALARLGAPASAYPDDILTEDSAAFENARRERAKRQRAETNRDNFNNATNTLGTLSELGLKWHEALRGGSGATPAPAPAPAPAKSMAPSPAGNDRKPLPTLAADELVRGLFKTR